MTNPDFEGWLYKKSRHFGAWRARWAVLEGHWLFTFKEKQKYTDPTECIDLLRYSNTLSLGQREKGYSFALTSAEPSGEISSYEFAVEDDEDFKSWKHKIERIQLGSSQDLSV